MPVPRIPRIHSNKQEVSWSNLGENAAAQKTVSLIFGVEAADADASAEVTAGHTVKSVYVEFNVSAETIAETKIVHWQVVGQHSGETTDVPSIYYSDNRANVLKRGMEMLPKDVSTIFKRIFVVNIPKKFQRIQKNWVLKFNYISTSSNTQNLCGFAIYKDLY